MNRILKFYNSQICKSFFSMVNDFCVLFKKALLQGLKDIYDLYWVFWSFILTLEPLIHFSLTLYGVR